MTLSLSLLLKRFDSQSPHVHARISRARARIHDDARLSAASEKGPRQRARARARAGWSEVRETGRAAASELVIMLIRMICGEPQSLQREWEGGGREIGALSRERERESSASFASARARDRGETSLSG